MPAHKGNKYAEKEVNWKLIDNLLAINCTGEEIATVLGVDYDTIANHCKKDFGLKFSEYIKKGNEKFKVSLKRLQYRSAQGDIQDGGKIIPSVTMQIWLGKQYLDQKDKSEVDQNVKIDKIELDID